MDRQHPLLAQCFELVIGLSSDRLEVRFLIQPSWVVRIAVNLGNEIRHDFEFRVVRRDMDIKVAHVVL